MNSEGFAFFRWRALRDGESSHALDPVCDWCNDDWLRGRR
jgi:hypothetical protein